MQKAKAWGNPPSIQPAIDHAAAKAVRSGVPVSRRASNSTTTSHVDHGHSGVSAGAGNWQAQAAHHLQAQVARNQAHYEAHTPPHQKARDLELNAAGERWLKRTQGEAALRAHHERVGREGLAYHPELLAHMRTIGAEEEAREQQAAGRAPRPATPTPPKATVGGASTKPSQSAQLYRHSARAA